MCVRSSVARFSVCVCERASISIHPISVPTSLLRSAVVAQLVKQPANYRAPPFVLASAFVFPLILTLFHYSGSQNLELNKRNSHMCLQSRPTTLSYPESYLQMRADTQAQSTQSATAPFGLSYPHHYSLCLLRLDDLWRWKPEEPIRAHRTHPGLPSFFSTSSIHPATPFSTFLQLKTIQRSLCRRIFCKIFKYYVHCSLLLINCHLCDWLHFSLTTLWPTNTGRIEWCQRWLFGAFEQFSGVIILSCLPGELRWNCWHLVHSYVVMSPCCKKPLTCVKTDLSLGLCSYLSGCRGVATSGKPRQFVVDLTASFFQKHRAVIPSQHSR